MSRFYEAVLWRRRIATEQAFVRKTFRDADSLYAAYRAGQPIDRVVLRDGRELVHPKRVGLLATLIELWHHRGYTQGLYRPRPNDTVIDAGANVGIFSAYVLSTCPQTRVLAIEPEQDNLGYLKQNLKTFGGHVDDITAAAIGPEPGTAQFLIAERSLDHRIITAPKDEQTSRHDNDAPRVVNVPVVTLDMVMQQAGVERVAMLKLDIESAEYALLDGLSDAMLRRFDRIAIEPHPKIAGRPADDLIRRLQDLFDVRWYGPQLQAKRR